MTETIVFQWFETGHCACACSSSDTCSESKMKHYTLVRRDKSSQTNSSNKKTIQAHAYSTESEDKFQTAVVSSHRTPSHEGQHLYSYSTFTMSSNVLQSTAYVSLSETASKDTQMRALLDSGSEASFSAEAKVKALMLSFIKKYRH